MCIIFKKNVEKNVFPYMLFMQWHITAKCDQKCKHCYMFDSNYYKSEIENELSYDDCIKIIDDFYQTATQLNTECGIIFGGGDPLLRDDFFDLLKYSKDIGINLLCVIGNPYHINDETASKLKFHGVDLFQLSIDGLEITHDHFRKPGSFKDTFRAFNVLKKHKINTACMLTASKSNVDEIIDVYELCAKNDITHFDFDRLVPMGNGSELKNEVINSRDYYAFLIKFNKKYKELTSNGYKTMFSYKDTLWSKISDTNIKNNHILPNNITLERGCIIGKYALSVLADGTVLPCRKLPISVGNISTTGFFELLKKAETLSKYTLNTDNKQCEKSDCFEKCIGCRAVSYGYYENILNSCDPQCFNNTLVL